MDEASLKLIECPRDAMQGWKNIIPTEQKVEYLNSLLKVGFHTLDCGSFVSAKAIPQMADTPLVLEQLEVENSLTKLLVIVANSRGAEQAIQFDQVTFLGFPFSVSPTFQLKNTNSTIGESLRRVDVIQELCVKSNKKLVVYLSMGFGNPYGDEYNQDILLHWAGELVSHGIEILSLADTVGMATPQQIDLALKTLMPAYSAVEFGVHLHSTELNWHAKFQAAIDAGCKRFDGALKGIGGCPMATDNLVGNMNTEYMIADLEQRNLLNTIDHEALHTSLQIADRIFI